MSDNASAAGVAVLIAYVDGFDFSLHDSSADRVLFFLMMHCMTCQMHAVSVSADAVGQNSPWTILDLSICASDARNLVCVGGPLLQG